MVRVLYVDSDIGAVKRLYSEWGGQQRVRLEDIACNGDEAITLLKQKDYDVMVTDLILKGHDGFCVLKTAERLCKHMRIMLYTAVSDPRLLNMAMENGANYVQLRPCGAAELLNAIERVHSGFFDKTVMGAHQTSVTVGSAMENAITRLLFRIGMNPKLKGFHLVREAVAENLRLVHNGERRLGDIYGLLAERHHVRYICVERNIRNAIETAWVVGNTEFINQIFGYTVPMERGKPTNGEFISLISDHIRAFSQNQISDRNA